MGPEPTVNICASSMARPTDDPSRADDWLRARIVRHHRDLAHSHPMSDPTSDGQTSPRTKATGCLGWYSPTSAPLGSWIFVTDPHCASWTSEQLTLLARSSVISAARSSHIK